MLYFTVFQLFTAYDTVNIAGLHPKSPIILHDNLQRESHQPNGPPTSAIIIQLLCKQMHTGTSTALTGETK